MRHRVTSQASPSARCFDAYDSVVVCVSDLMNCTATSPPGTFAFLLHAGLVLPPCLCAGDQTDFVDCLPRWTPLRPPPLSPPTNTQTHTG